MQTIKQLPALIIALFSIVFFIDQTTFAQDQFKLSDYKNPDYRWHQLDVNFGLAGTNNFDKQTVENGISDKQANSRFNNNLSADYYGKKNSISYQGFQNFGFLSSLSTNRMNYENLDDASQENQSIIRNGNASIYFNTVNRFYNKKMMFLEADLSGYGSYDRTVSNNSAEEEELPYSYKHNEVRYQFNASIPLKAGIGRIEEVQDARLAVYILDDLQNSGDIKKAPTKEETLAFAEFITKVKNQRYFDSRLRKIAEITAIDSFLTVKGLKAESDASYYTLINDDWDYANGPVRSTGGRFSIGVTPSFGYNLWDDEEFVRDTLFDPDIIESTSYLTESQTNIWSLNLNSGYIYEKPSSLYWQHTFVTNLSYQLYHNDYKNESYSRDTLTTGTSLRTDSPRLICDIGYKIGYYPNSRTKITLGIVSAYTQNWGSQVSDEDEENKTDIGQILVSNNIQLSCYYYISPQLRLSCGLTSAYDFIKQNQAKAEDVEGDQFEHQFRNMINASLVYSIF